MRRVSRALAVSGLLAGAALVLLSPGGRAQTPAGMGGQKVNFNSVDGVKLYGMFYEAAKKNAPTVMILHAIGESSRRKEYSDLAAALQKEGYAVLTFDLRGHGQSTTVDEKEFWSARFPTNRANIRGIGKDTIELRDIQKSYYTVFVNDIAAARAFLDRKNDGNDCNSSNLTIIGADTGATLGAIWMSAEWHRYKLVALQPNFPPTQPDLANPAGKNYICGIWLSITPDLGTRKVNLSSLLYKAGKEKKVPMAFIYNGNDPSDKKTAIGLANYIKGNKKEKGYELTDKAEVKAGKKLRGCELLKASLGTDREIISYLQKVVDEKGNEWQEQEFRKSLYVWQIGSQRPVSIKGPADSALRFSLYLEFLH